MKGPALLASNHPNSFLDGIILTTLFHQPLYTLARGDAFKNKLVAGFLRYLRLLPIYRTSEGVQNLGHNYSTFDVCLQVFKSDGIVLIFAEGGCENEWHLRPLKKGTARLALTAWENNIELTVIPVGINYSSFRKFGKQVHVQFGAPISAKTIPFNNTGRDMLLFNQKLKQQLQEVVYEMDSDDRTKIARQFPSNTKGLVYWLALPAALGCIVHAPLYYMGKLFTQLFFHHSDHYDSVQTSLLIISYPPYILFLVLIISDYVGWHSIFLIILLPFLAWAAMRSKLALSR